MNGADRGAEAGRSTMSFRAVISSLCVALLLVSATPAAWAQNQDGTTTAKKKKTTNSAPKSGGGDSQSGGTSGERGTGSY
jgi:hypothetical protein